jgi:hypothetical protein
LADLTTVLESIGAFLAGSGLTGLFIVIYQTREQSKEAAREHLLQSVLTKEFFECLDNVVTFSALAKCWLNVREGRSGMTTIIIDGRLVTATDEAIRPELNNVMLKAMTSNEKARRTGSLFLMPKQIGDAFDKLFSETALAVNKIKNNNEIDDSTIQKLEVSLTNLQRAMQDALGLSKLDC